MGGVVLTPTEVCGLRFVGLKFRQFPPVTGVPQLHGPIKRARSKELTRRRREPVSASNQSIKLSINQSMTKTSINNL
jgi:hypothetical protein